MLARLLARGCERACLAVRRHPASLVRLQRRYALDGCSDDTAATVADDMSSAISRSPLLGRQERIQPTIREEELDEKFIKGGGKGGQKINKTSNCVELRHKPTGIRLACQATRSLSDNRRIARKLMLSKLDDYLNGEQSQAALKIKKEQNKKRKKKQRSDKKYGAARESLLEGSQESI